MTRKVLAWTGHAAGALGLLLLLYIAAGLVGGAIPSNRDWRPPPSGIEIWVEDNGIHTGIVVPKVAAGLDLRPILPAHDLADPRYAQHPYASFGWGDHAFYLETPTWAEVSPRTVLAAAVGSERTLLHVDHLPRPRESATSRHLVVTPRQYRRLAAYILATRAERPRAWRGYAKWDAFYAARGRYSAIRTCNAWTGDALRFAGVRVGWWTPFPDGVMRWFPAS